jgi:hypothetical protein
MTHSNRHQPAVAALAALTMIVNPSLPLVSAVAQAQTAPAAKPAAATQTAPAAKAPAAGTAAAPAPPVDGGWPRVHALPSGASMLLYQPQIASWDKQTTMVAFSAVSYRASATETKPAMGTVKFEADTKVSVSDRLVSFQNVRITEATFGTLDKDKIREITEQIDKGIPDDERVIALDRVLVNLDKSTIVAKNVEGVKADPPPIFFSKAPAVIVNIDGDPIWSPIKDNNLTFAVNTNWDLFQDTSTKTIYLRNNDSWLMASDVKGPWGPAGKLPESFKKLPADDNWKDVKAALPGKSVKMPPKVFVTDKPGELILLTGEPSYVTVAAGSSLLWVNNTESDVFRLGKTGPVYYLVTGRWFSAPDFTGPWTFATPSLPPDFRKIPLEHPRSRVLASVPGTDEAAEAVLVAQIPQTARVNKKELKAPDVAFQGDPQFQPIEQTTVQRAVNTDKDVFLIAGMYYMCYQGVWFVAKAANGPWEVAQSVPQEIYKIPASSPASHVTYVTIEDDDSSDEWVTFAAAAAYTGVMVAWGCTVWGSGWYYPPYYGFYGGYPYYYGHFPTYGYSAWYNPRTGAYGRSAGVYGPYGGVGVGARYNPRTGTYARGAAAYGPYGARGAAQAYNPRTGTYAQTRQGSNVYGSWGSTSVQRGDDWAKTNRYTNNRTGNTTRTVRTDEGAGVVRKGDDGGRVAAGSGGNVYAGKDGNVYRKDSGGTWQKYDNGNWNNTPNQPSGERPRPNDNTGTNRAGTGARTQPSAGATSTDRSTMDQLNRDSRARSEGTQRTNDYSSYRGGSSSSTPRSTGSYRGSSGGGASRGGASRGGGGGGRR